MTKIEAEHPGYIHELFLQGQRMLGGMATFEEIVVFMNERSSMAGEDRLTLCLSRKQLSKWFNCHNGKIRSPIEKNIFV